MQISVQSLPLELINYLISKIQKHGSRYPWMLEQDGFRKWQSSEHAFEYPIPNYCSDSYAESIRIIEKFRPSIVPVQDEWQATSTLTSVSQSGSTIIEACMRCYVTTKFGKHVDLSESLIKEMCPDHA